MKRLIVLFLLFSACSGDSETGQNIIDKTIEVSGSNSLDQKEVQFWFRGREYGAKFNGGKYEYVRLFKDSTDLIRDVLNNDGFYREINGARVSVIDSMAAKYSNSVNSVIYFALLPKALNDEAVIKEYIGETSINGSTYEKVQVTFQQEGGGEDYSDVFVYWINKDSQKIDYLGYSYETDGGGIRFRSAENERYVKGVRFVDYKNFKPSSEMPVSQLDEVFVNGGLELVSTISIENITINEYVE